MMISGSPVEHNDGLERRMEMFKHCINMLQNPNYIFNHKFVALTPFIVHVQTCVGETRQAGCS